MFQKARITLTLWYLLIIMFISMLFSIVIYSGVTREFDRIERFEKIRLEDEKKRAPFFEEFQKQRRQQGLPIPSVRRIDPQMIPKARVEIITILGIVNFLILFLSGFVGYFLAGRTLKPIRDMVTEQNRFVTDASHELRTPLTSLRSEIEVNLRNKKMTLEQSKKLLESNLEEVMSLQILSDSLLELSQNGKATTTPFTAVSLADCVAGAIKKLEGNIKKKQIKVVKKISHSSVFGVQDRICELFVILLDNAIKYSPKNSQITITAEKQKDFVHIIIKDQGMGIAKEDLPHIFDRFYRVSKSRSKDEIPGYGLGLSIAQKIVQSHNGTIHVASEIHKGTVFTIVLPNHR